MEQIQIEKIIDEHGEHLIRLAYFYVRDRETAKDIVQEVFITLYEKVDYEEQGKLRAYLTTMTANRCKDHLRSWSFRNLQFNKDWMERIHIQQDPLILQEEKADIAIAILELPIKYREIILFYYYEECTMKEIAQLLGISENTVKTRMTKARKLLKKELQSDYWEVLSIE
ncbi:sigma-70 family RNA polymerase sigma factor [Sporosarcina sp. FSL W7-1349]|uniref:sigma-70 family RNA polymerase sigma factor n=1 Tax=Sporosarcina sp. FSL W7-1349 TaxID=2921561 RepID=UPI0030FCB0C3